MTVSGGKDADATLRTIALRLEYDGTRFAGWQRQDGQRTVQGEIEAAIERIVGERATVHGSGRTDAGVHALGQVASFRARTRIGAAEIGRALSAMLPEDIAVLGAWEADADFHARFGAASKVYRYRVLNRRERSAIDRAFSHRVAAPLDLDAMRAAAAVLLGRHDFRAFCTEATSRNDTVRTVSRLDLERRGDYIVVEIEADGFLYNMVRSIVGTLLLVGTAKMSVDAFRNVFLSRDRRRAGPTAPARGLFLVEVRY